MAVPEKETSEQVNANGAWRYGVVGNIAKTHIDKQGVLRYGSSAYRGGTKVYLCGKYWKKEYSTIGVIGLNRYKRYEFSDVSSDMIENVRCQRVYRPSVLALMDNWEFSETWWGKSAEDKTDVKKFVDYWKNEVTPG